MYTSSKNQQRATYMQLQVRDVVVDSAGSVVAGQFVRLLKRVPVKRGASEACAQRTWRLDWQVGQEVRTTSSICAKIVTEIEINKLTQLT